MNTDIEKMLRAGRRLAAKTQAGQKKVLMTFHVPQSTRDAAAKKAKTNHFNMSSYLEMCVEVFLDTPIENEVKAMKRQARASIEKAERFSSSANRFTDELEAQLPIGSQSDDE
jgi:hypothetical protein